MATSNAGRTLTPDEVQEYTAYQNAGLPQPDRFASVVFENTTASGVVYRYQTDAEVKAATTAAEANARQAQAEADLDAKVRAEAAQRAGVAEVAAPPPPPPAKDK